MPWNAVNFTDSNDRSAEWRHESSNLLRFRHTRAAVAAHSRLGGWEPSSKIPLQSLATPVKEVVITLKKMCIHQVKVRRYPDFTWKQTMIFYAKSVWLGGLGHSGHSMRPLAMKRILTTTTNKISCTWLTELDLLPPPWVFKFKLQPLMFGANGQPWPQLHKGSRFLGYLKGLPSEYVKNYACFATIH